MLSFHVLVLSNINSKYKVGLLDVTMTDSKHIKGAQL